MEFLRKRGLQLFVFAVMLTLPVAVFADQTVPDVVAPPEWLGSLLVFLQGLPYAGPILVEVFKWVGLIAAAATALSIAAEAVLRLPEIVARYAKAEKLADKIKNVRETAQPYLKYFSIFNVQKK